jgi:hypothetical protein
MFSVQQAFKSLLAAHSSIAGNPTMACIAPLHLQAPAMEWNEGHTWTLNVQLPVGAVNFKVVMSEAHGGVRWEQGDNRSMLIPETTSVSGAPVGQVSKRVLEEVFQHLLLWQVEQ